MTDHMLEIDWTQNDGWDAPKIIPFQHLMIHPANSSLHYALQCFEGMKGYPHHNGSAINLFRAIENCKRLKSSFEYLAFPKFNEEELLKCIIDLVKLDREWMPKKPLHSLYIRPTGISMDNTLGVKAANAVKLYVILSPVGPYYPSGFKPVSIYTSLDSVRAWPHGSGNRKFGANYGPTIYAMQQVQKKGYD